MFSKLGEAMAWAVDAASPYVYSGAKLLTAALAVQSSVKPFEAQSSENPYQLEGPKAFALSKFSHPGLRGGHIEPAYYSDMALPNLDFTSAGDQTHFLAESITDSKLGITDMPLDEIKFKAGGPRSLLDQDCKSSAGTVVGVVRTPDATSYTEGQPFTITVSNTATPTVISFTVTFNLLTTSGASFSSTPGVNLVSLQMPYSSSVSVTCYPQFDTGAHYNGQIIISYTIQNNIVAPQCQTYSATTVYSGINVFDPLKPYVPMSRQEVSVGSTGIYTPSNVFTNFDKVATSLTASINGTALPSFIKFDNSSGFGSFSIMPQSGNQGTKTVTLKYQQVGNATNFATSSFDIFVPNNKPTVDAGVPSQAVVIGQKFDYTLPDNAFRDPDGDPLSYIIAGSLPTGMSFNQSTRNFVWTPTKSSPTSTVVFVGAKDFIGATEYTSMLVKVDPSLKTAEPAVLPTIDETISLDSPSYFVMPAYDVVTLSPFDITMTYKLGSVQTGSLRCNSTNVVSSYNRVTGVLEVVGPASKLNSATVIYDPELYYSGPVDVEVKVDDGINPIKGPIPARGTVNFVYIPLKAGSAMQNTTLVIGQNTLIDFPATAVQNPHKLTLTYSAKLVDGSALPTWMSFNPTTGSITANPRTGNQGEYAVVIRAQDKNNLSNYVDLAPLGLSLPNHVPTVTNPLGSQSIERGRAFNFIVPANTFSDIDGNEDIVSITAEDMPAGMTFDAPTRTLRYVPTKEAPSSSRIKLTAIDSKGEKATTYLDLGVISSLAVNPVGQNQTYVEDTNFVLPKVMFDTPTTGTITLTYQLDNPSAGRLSLSSSSMMTSTYQAGIGKLSVQGTKDQLLAAIDKIIFAPTPDFNDDVDIVFKIDDGLNPAVSQTLSLTGTPTYDALLPGNSPVSVAILPTRLLQFTISEDTFNNRDKDELLLSLEVRDSVGALVADSTTSGWTLTVDSTSKKASVIAPVGVQGDYTLWINAQALDAERKPIANKMARVSTTLTVDKTIQITNREIGSSIFEDSLPNNATLTPIMIDYLGEQNAIVTLTLSSAIGTIEPTNFGGISPAITSSNGFVTWRLAAAKAVLNQHLANLKLLLASHFNGLGNTLSWLVENGVDPAQRFNSALDVVPIHHSPTIGDRFLDKQLTAGDSFTWTIPSTSFAAIHQDPNTFSIAVTQDNDTPLPSWMRYDNVTRTITGTVPSDFNGGIGFKVTATDSSNDPAIPLAARQVSQTFRANIAPTPSFFDERAKTTVSSVAGALALPSTILLLTLYIYNRRNSRWKSARAKLEATMGKIKVAYYDHALAPSTEEIANVFKRIKGCIKTGVITEESYKDLEQFTQLFTALALTNSDDRKLLYQQLKVMELLDSYAKEIGGAIKQNRFNARTDFLLQFCNALLDLVILTETAHKQTLDIYEKLVVLNQLRLATDITPSLSMRVMRLFADCCIRPCFGTEDDLDKRVPEKVRSKYKNLKAALSRIEDEDSLCGIFGRLRKGQFRVTQVPDYPKSWYDHILFIHAITPLAQTDLKALAMLQAVYRDAPAKYWHVVVAAKEALKHIAANAINPAIRESAAILPVRIETKVSCFTRTFCRKEAKSTSRSERMARPTAIIASAKVLPVAGSAKNPLCTSPDRKHAPDALFAVANPMSGAGSVKSPVGEISVPDSPETPPKGESVMKATGVYRKSHVTLSPQAKVGVTLFPPLKLITEESSPTTSLTVSHLFSKSKGDLTMGEAPRAVRLPTTAECN